MIGLWVLDFMILWALAAGDAQAETQIPDGVGYFLLAVFLLSGPVAYWIGRRKWMLILPLAIVLVLRVIGFLIARSQRLLAHRPAPGPLGSSSPMQTG